MPGPRSCSGREMTTTRRRLAIVPLTFLGYLFVYPVTRIIVTGLGGSGTSFFDAVTSPTTLGVIWFTTWQAVASTLVTLLIGLPAAWAVSRLGLSSSRWFLAVTTVPFVLPTVVVGVAFSRLIADTPLEHGATVVIAAHAFYNVAIVIRLVGVRWAQLGDHLEAAARTLGAGAFTTFRRVTLPSLASSLRAAGSLTFLLSFTSFGTVLILGGLRLRTIEVEIWRQATQRLDFGAAAALAVVQLVVVGLALAWQERTSMPRRSAVRSRPRSTSQRRVGVVILTGLGALLAVPILSLVRTSAANPGAFATLAGGEVLGLSVGRAVITSLTYALVATAVAVTVGTITSAFLASGTRGVPLLDRLVLLPLGTSAVTVGLGFLVALDWPIDLRASRVLVPLAHALVAIPFVTRTMTPALAAVPIRLRESAAVLGASPAQAWRRVEWPIIARAALVGAGFAFAISIGEFGATAFVARPADPTLPLLVYRALGRPGTVGIAASGSLLLMAVTAIAVLAVDRFRTGEEAL